MGSARHYGILKTRGGFEAALEDQRTQTFKFSSPLAEFSSPIAAMMEPVQRLEDAIGGMFADMNKAFATTHFEWGENQGREMWIRNFLMMFDAIFTLNQDLLLEPHYFNSGFGRPEYSVYREWDGWQIPGMEPIPPDSCRRTR